MKAMGTWWIYFVFSAPVLGGVVLVVSALVTVRSFGKHHCRRCGYDLRGSRAQCPECGAARNENRWNGWIELRQRWLRGRLLWGAMLIAGFGAIPAYVFFGYANDRMLLRSLHQVDPRAVVTSGPVDYGFINRCFPVEHQWLFQRVRAIQVFELTDGKLEDLRLDRFERLEILNISFNRITNKSVHTLGELGSILIVEILGTGIDREGYLQLSKYLPRAEIIWSPELVEAGND